MKHVVNLSHESMVRFCVGKSKIENLSYSPNDSEVNMATKGLRVLNKDQMFKINNLFVK